MNLRKLSVTKPVCVRGLTMQKAELMRCAAQIGRRTGVAARQAACGGVRYWSMAM